MTPPVEFISKFRHKLSMELLERIFCQRVSTESQKTIAELSKKLTDLTAENVKLHADNTTLSSLLEQRSLQTTIPSWLDETKIPYRGWFTTVSKTKVEKTLVRDVREIFTSGPTLRFAGTWEKLSHDAKLVAIWHFIIDHVSYRYDEGEDWQLPIVTFWKGTGDCEDSSALFVELCRLFGVRADKVLMATGWFTKGKERFGHAFPIAQMEDGKWYVFETTLNFKPAAPKLLKGSNYDISWGVSNWLYAGKAKFGAVQI